MNYTINPKTYTGPELRAKLQRCGVKMSRQSLVFAVAGRRDRGWQPYLIENVHYSRPMKNKSIIYNASALDKIIEVEMKKAVV